MRANSKLSSPFLLDDTLKRPISLGCGHSCLATCISILVSAAFSNNGVSFKETAMSTFAIVSDSSLGST